MSHVKDSVEKIEEVFNRAFPNKMEENHKLAMIWCYILDWFGIEALVSPVDDMFRNFMGCISIIDGDQALVVPKLCRSRRENEPIQSKEFNITQDDKQVTEWKILRFVSENRD